jgi:hypothetical protein
MERKGRGSVGKAAKQIPSGAKQIPSGNDRKKGKNKGGSE